VGVRQNCNAGAETDWAFREISRTRVAAVDLLEGCCLVRNLSIRGGVRVAVVNGLQFVFFYNLPAHYL
jgi:hypothetical protein